MPQKDDMRNPAAARSAALAAVGGDPVTSTGNKPVALDDSDVAWFVEQGSLDVFLVEYRDGRAASSLKHVLRVGAGHLVFGVPRPTGDDGLVAVGKGLPGCRLRRAPLAAFLHGGAADAVAAEVDGWIAAFAGAVARDIDPYPKPDLRLEVDGQADVAVGEVVVAAGGVVWVPTGEGASFLGTEDAAPDGPGVFPVTEESWAVMSGSARLTGVSSRTLNAEGRLLPALTEFHRVALGAERINRRLSLVDDANLQRSTAVHRRRDVEQARRGLLNVLRPGGARAEDRGSAL